MCRCSLRITGRKETSTVRRRGPEQETTVVRTIAVRKAVVRITAIREAATADLRAGREETDRIAGSFSPEAEAVPVHPGETGETGIREAAGRVKTAARAIAEVPGLARAAAAVITVPPVRAVISVLEAGSAPEVHHGTAEETADREPASGTEIRIRALPGKHPQRIWKRGARTKRDAQVISRRISGPEKIIFMRRKRP